MANNIENTAFSQSLRRQDTKENISISTQTEWSWLEDVRRIDQLGSAGKSHNKEPLLDDGGSIVDNENGPGTKDHFNEPKEDSSTLPKIATKSLPNLNDLRKSAKQNGSNDQKNWLQNHPLQQETHTPGGLDNPRGSISEDSDSDSSEEEYDLGYPPFPGVGPPQMLEFLKHADTRGRIDVADLGSEFPPVDEKWLHTSFFSGPCQFCGADVLPLPTVEEIKTLPNGKLYCCNQYEEFIKMYLTYVDKRGATNDVIDIKPHAPYGTKAARKAAKERAAERMREKEMERQKAVTAQANVFSFSRQIKTLQYALSSVKCMEDGWTIRPPTPLIEEPVTNDDDFAIEVNTTLLQRTNQLYQRFYENGNRFLVIFADGTGCCYYPSGNVAVLIISHELGKYTYVLQTDTDDYDTDDTGVLGVFEPNGNGTCYYKDGSLRLVLTQHSGVHIDKHGSYRKKWNWHFIRGHVHTPPFQPICFALNQQLSCRVMEQDNIVVTFASGQRAVRFNVGAKLKKSFALSHFNHVHALDHCVRFMKWSHDILPLAIKHTIPPLAKKDEHADFMESTRKKVQSIYDKVQLTMRFPNSPKLKTLVSNTQQKERKNTTAGTSSKVHLPKLKEKPSVVVN